LQLASLVEAIAGSLQRAGGDGSHRATIGVQGISAQARRWTLPEAEAIPLALSLNELLANAVKHGGGADVECTLLGSDDEVRIEIRNRGRLPEGFSLDRVGSGVFGLGLVRALLPRRSALLQLQQEADRVLTRLTLHPPSVTMAS
jgi:signal transduction histidine kinase